MEPPRELFLPLLRTSTTALSEDELLLLWKYICPRLNNLSTVTGKSLRVGDPGCIERSEGPDVRDVKVELNGITRSGSVEIHRQTADWYHHDHHSNSVFNTVVLHVVLTGERVNVRRKDDRWVETVMLKDHLDAIKSLLESIDRETVESRRKAVKRPCYRENPDPERLRDRLNQAGRVWLDKRAARLRKRSESPLLQSTIEALGYSRNHESFRRLSERLDLDQFREVLTNDLPTERFEAFLLGKGGWFDRAGTFNRAIYCRRRVWERSWVTARPGLDVDQWTLSGVRPHARPVRRWVNFGWTLRGLAELGWTWRGWVNKIVRTCINEGEFRSRLHGSLNDVFGYPSNNYWNHHYSLRDQRRGSVPSPVGPGWFDQLAVNVMLPFLYYESFARGNRDLREKVVDRFMKYPAELTNRRTRRIKQQWGVDEATEVYETAAHQQGAIHLYKQGCVPGRCERCDLKRSGAKTGHTLFDSLR